MSKHDIFKAIYPHANRIERTPIGRTNKSLNSYEERELATRKKTHSQKKQIVCGTLMRLSLLIVKIMEIILQK